MKIKYSVGSWMQRYMKGEVLVTVHTQSHPIWKMFTWSELIRHKRTISSNKWLSAKDLHRWQIKYKLSGMWRNNGTTSSDWFRIPNRNKLNIKRMGIQ